MQAAIDLTSIARAWYPPLALLCTFFAKAPSETIFTSLFTVCSIVSPGGCPFKLHFSPNLFNLPDLHSYKKCIVNIGRAFSEMEMVVSIKLENICLTTLVFEMRLLVQRRIWQTIGWHLASDG